MFSSLEYLLFISKCWYCPYGKQLTCPVALSPPGSWFCGAVQHLLQLHPHLAVSFSYTEILTQPPGCVAEHLPFFCQDPLSSWASLMAQLVKNLSAMQDTQDRFLGWEDRRDRLPTPVFLDFPCDSAGKQSACNAGDLCSIPGLGRSPGEGKGYPLQCSGLKNSMSPWGGNESDTTFTFFPLG